LFGGKYDLIQLLPEFVLIFITSPSQGKLGRMAAKRLLTLASLVAMQ
jgi:hypothetical protein